MNRIVVLVFMYLLLIVFFVFPNIRRLQSLMQYEDELYYAQAGLIFILMIVSIIYAKKNWGDKKLVLCVFPLVVYSIFTSFSFVIFNLAILGVIPLR
ncbi:hypothetical protein [Zooshikella sp. RANM57]|uniref:hypothetical protein n=1 Tax=Zooshikella sp. RANM57 TaxID=3425863 RepID=UPI003D6E5D10